MYLRKVRGTSFEVWGAVFSKKHLYDFDSRFRPVRGGANSESRGQFKLAPQSRGQQRAPLFFLLCLFPVGEAVRDLLLIGAAVQLRSASEQKSATSKNLGQVVSVGN